MQFRKDINGLRALALIPIVLYHYNASWIPGGIAAVDVLFVISGFLMTGIIFKGFEKGDFSILSFYVARANRVVPAMAVLCLVILAFGWFYLTPMDYKVLGKHVGSSIGFLSNIIYWTEAGYFDPASHEKWLLHTWTLSVEWQFYMIYPLVLVAMKKCLSLKTIKVSIVFAAIFGYVFCVIASYKWPDAAYYMLPTRVWEMLLGGIAYLYPLKLQEENKKPLQWFGLALIIGAYALVSKENPWPGYLAIFPVLGVFFVIQAQRNDGLIARSIVFQRLGDWSYSIYLWHWPLVVAIHYFSLSESFVYIFIGLSVFIGYLSNKYIEKLKFRSKFDNIFGYLNCNALYVTLVVAILGSAVFLNSGFEQRNPEAALAQAVKRAEHYEYCFANVRGKKTNEYCVFHADGTYDRDITANVDVIVLGDSHASVTVTSLLESMRRNNIKGDLLFYGHPACLPLSGKIDDVYMNANYAESCSFRNRGIIALIENVKNNKTKIVLVNRLPVFFYGMNEVGADKPLQNIHFMSESRDIEENKSLVMNSYKKLIDEIKNIAEIYILLPVPEQKVHVPNVFSREIMLHGNTSRSGISLTSYMDRNSFIFKELQGIKGIHLIDPTVKMCDAISCLALQDNKSLYYDEDHLSVFGAHYISSIFDVLWEPEHNTNTYSARGY
jgi:peptidoglycan/LPS O-acetylase OafA/YrhL